MYVMLSDETNTTPGDGRKFLIYRGLIVPLASLPGLTADIECIRREAGYSPSMSLR